MQVVSSPARQARTYYRHEMCQLTYVVLDAGNGGILRNLNRDGAGIQAVARLRQQQRVRLRFELNSRVRVDINGEVSWANASGQCGIRFLDLPVCTSHQIDEWMFSNLIDAAARHAAEPISMFAKEMFAQEKPQEDVALPAASLAPSEHEALQENRLHRHAPLGWLLRLSSKTLARTIDSLIVLAALLLFGLIFLSITHDLPPWPLALGALLIAAAFVGGAYLGVHALFRSETLGARLAKPQHSKKRNMRLRTDSAEANSR